MDFPCCHQVIVILPHDPLVDRSVHPEPTYPSNRSALYPLSLYDANFVSRMDLLVRPEGLNHRWMMYVRIHPQLPMHSNALYWMTWKPNAPGGGVRKVCSFWVAFDFMSLMSGEGLVPFQTQEEPTRCIVWKFAMWICCLIVIESQRIIWRYPM